MIADHEIGARIAVWIGYSLFALNKIGNCGWRILAYVKGMDADLFFLGVAYLDAFACFTGQVINLGMLSDVICCSILYKRTSNVFRLAEAADEGKERSGISKLANLVRRSSLFRICLISVIKIVSGSFMLSHLCFTQNEKCEYGFLRGVITTVDYQLYYMDYLLTQSAKKETKETQNTTRIQDSIAIKETLKVI